VLASVRAPSAAQIANLIINALAADRTLSAHRRIGQAFSPEYVLREHLRPLLDRTLGTSATSKTPDVSLLLWGEGSADVSDAVIARLWKGRRSEVVLRCRTLNALSLREAAQRARGRALGIVNVELEVPADAPSLLLDRVAGQEVAGAALHPIFRHPEGRGEDARSQFINEQQYASLDFGIYRADLLRLIRLSDDAQNSDALAVELMQRLVALGTRVDTLTAAYRGPNWQRSPAMIARAV
jgi:hypothetical protein